MDLQKKSMKLGNYTFRVILNRKVYGEWLKKETQFKLTKKFTFTEKLKLDNKGKGL